MTGSTTLLDVAVHLDANVRSGEIYVIGLCDRTWPRLCGNSFRSPRRIAHRQIVLSTDDSRPKALGHDRPLGRRATVPCGILGLRLDKSAREVRREP